MSNDENELLPDLYTGTCCPKGDRDWSDERLTKAHGLEGELSERAIYEVPQSVLEKLDLRGVDVDYRHKDIHVGKIVNQKFERGGDLGIDFRLNATPMAKMVKASVDRGDMLGLSLSTMERISPQTYDLRVHPIEVSICREGMRPGTWIRGRTDANGEHWKTCHASAENGKCICDHPRMIFVVRRVMASTEQQPAAPAAPAAAPASQPALAASSAASSSSASTSSATSASPSASAPAPVIPAPEIKESKEEKKQLQAPAPPPAPFNPYSGYQPPAPNSLGSLAPAQAPASMSQPPTQYPPYQQWSTPPAYNPYAYYGYQQPPPPQPYYYPPMQASSSSMTAAPAPVAPPAKPSENSTSVSDAVAKSVSMLQQQMVLLMESLGESKKQQQEPASGSSNKAMTGLSSSWMRDTDTGRFLGGRQEDKSPEFGLVKASREFLENNKTHLDAIDSTGQWVKPARPTGGPIIVEEGAWGESCWVSVPSLAIESHMREETDFDTMVCQPDPDRPAYQLAGVQ